MRRITTVIATFLWIGALGCEPAETPGTQAQGVTRADSVGIALKAFEATVFDTIAWESTEVRSERGALVFRISCEKCHGPHGAGDGRFVLQGDTLRPPSFLAEDWTFADRPMELRRHIFTGTAAGMPYWGLVGLNYRDIDAVAHFLESPLRGVSDRP